MKKEVPGLSKLSEEKKERFRNAITEVQSPKDKKLDAIEDIRGNVSYAAILLWSGVIMGASLPMWSRHVSNTIKDLPDRHKTESKAMLVGAFGLLGLALECIAIMVVMIRIMDKKARKRFAENTKIYEKVEQLKLAGLSEAQIQEIYDTVGAEIIAKMSEMDQKYVDNLINGGLDNANYDAAIAIIKGYLIKDIKNYAKLIENIDEATLTPDIIRQGRTISWDDAYAMSQLGKEK